MVEFQPSGFRKGSYLNVGAHWLWSAGGYISFDLGSGADGESRIADFEEHESGEQFETAADRLAIAAAQEASGLAHRLPSIQATADLLLSREASLPVRGTGSWSTFHAGVAAGLAGREGEADTMLRSVTDDRVKGEAERFMKIAFNGSAFRATAASLIEGQRKALRLPQANAPLFEESLFDRKQP